MNQGMGNSGGMDFMQMMQSQILTFTSMKEGGNITHAIIGIILLTLFNNFMKLIPVIWKSIESLAKQYLQQKHQTYITQIQKKTIDGIVKIRKGTILFEKTSVSSDEEIVLALIRHISNLKTSQSILFNREFFVINQEEFIIEPEVYCRVINWENDDKGNISKYSFEVYSYEYNVERLKEIVDRIVGEYKQDKANNLGKQPYYFNEISIPVPRDIDGGYRFEAAQKTLMFDMTPFFTNKSLSNVFGQHLDIVKRRVDMFVNNPMWYQRKGIPHTLGILLSGPPGTGKTSAIKAIANDTGRHIFNISLSKMTTQTQLKKLFYSTEVKILKNGANEIVHIPIDKRIYVMEDIDALGDIVLDRRRKYNDNALVNSIQNNENCTQEYDKHIQNCDTINDSGIAITSNIVSASNVDNLSTLDYSSNNPLHDTNNNKFITKEKYSIMEDIMTLPNINSNNGFGTSLDEAFTTTLLEPVRQHTRLTDLHNSNNNISRNISYRNIDNDDTVSVKSCTSGKSRNSKKEDINKNPEEITLSFLLNLLDGVLETPGRIVIMTSNHPELLDPALVRPGRIDINLRVGFCTRDMVIDMFRFFYENKTINLTEKEWSYNNELTPAEISAILQNNFDNYEGAKIELINKTM